ncbi:MAG TPA: hypothetical protein VFS27_12255 [Blastocatellia bacterium]|jgi:hypothetical protein|nr:hypothetical protein [Blastocatellia bacterium]
MKLPRILWLLVASNLFTTLAAAQQSEYALSYQSGGGTPGQGNRNRERPAPVDDNDSKGAKIEGIYMHLTYSLMGVGGTLSMSYTPYLLLKDGTICKNLTTPPADLDVARSRQTQPNMWGRWEKSGTSIIVQWNDGKRETWKDQWYVTRPAGKNDRLRGGYGFLTSGGSTTAVAANDIEFSADGSFVRKGVVSDRHSPLYTTRRSESNGTYLLDGHTIELRYADGKVERRAFFFFPDSNDHIGIGGQVYSLRK